MNARERLKELLKGVEPGEEWLPDRRMPTHYKRLTCDMKEAVRLADLGGQELFINFGFKPFFTQGLIAGAILSGDYDKVTVVTVFQYGKTITVGHTALLLARDGDPVYVAANTSGLTDMVMGQVYAAVREASPSLKQEIVGDGLKKADKVGSSLSRQRIGYANGGLVEAVSLGGTYQDTEHNKAVGRGGAYIIDEAALVPESVYVETVRGAFARTDDKSYVQVAISNPHNPGWFYDDLTGECDKRHLVIWMDARTCAEEGRWSVEKILKDAESLRDDDIQRYLLCELPDAGMGMYGTPDLIEHVEGLSFLGVDAAYKGKDSIYVSHIVQGNGKLHVKEIAEVKKPKWVDGQTSKEIIEAISRVARAVDAAFVCVDIGFGVWLVEGLTLQGINVRGVNFGSGPTKERMKAHQYSAVNALNMRAEMHIDVQDLMENKVLTMSSKAFEQIKDVLPLITYERNATNKIRIRPKIEIKNLIGHSPDAWDALLLGVHAAIVYNAEN